MCACACVHVCVQGRGRGAYVHGRCFGGCVVVDDVVIVVIVVSFNLCPIVTMMAVTFVVVGTYFVQVSGVKTHLDVISKLQILAFSQRRTDTLNLSIECYTVGVSQRFIDT